jgi:Fe-S cluster biogenesis protein NfuA
MPGDPEFQRRLGSIEELLRQIESAADPNLRTTVRELVELIMSLHGAGLERILELIRGTGEAGEAVVEKLGRDELVTSLMVLYSLHPLNMETRIIRALDKVAPRLHSHGGAVELIRIQDGIVRLRLRIDGHSCGSTAQSLKEIIEGAIYQAAPDLAALEIEGAEEKPGFVPLEMLRNNLPATPVANLSVLAGGEGGM